MMLRKAQKKGPTCLPSLPTLFPNPLPKSFHAHASRLPLCHSNLCRPIFHDTVIQLSRPFQAEGPSMVETAYLSKQQRNARRAHLLRPPGTPDSRTVITRHYDMLPRHQRCCILPLVEVPWVATQPCKVCRALHGSIPPPYQRSGGVK